VQTVIAQTGALRGRTRRALDSTVLDDVIATQDTVTQLIDAIRRVRREVPGAAAVVGAVSRRGESHPRAPTEPCVTVSRHTALII